MIFWKKVTVVYSRKVTVICSTKKVTVICSTKKSPQQTVILDAEEHVSHHWVESIIHTIAHYNNAQSVSFSTVVGIHIIKIALDGKYSNLSTHRSQVQAAMNAHAGDVRCAHQECKFLCFYRVSRLVRALECSLSLHRRLKCRRCPMSSKIMADKNLSNKCWSEGAWWSTVPRDSKCIEK